MTCQHQLALCKLHNCTTCEHNGSEEHCPFAHNESVDECSPTFAQMLEVYGQTGNTRHVIQVIAAVRRGIKMVGLTEKSKCVEMTRSKFKTLIQLLTAPMADGRKLRYDTVKSYTSAFSTIVNESLEDAYNERGFDLPAFSIPKVVGEKTPVQEVSDRTIRKVEIEMEKWLASGKRSNVEAYKMCFFALYFGMRVGDICLAKWGIIHQTTAGMMIDYVPHKSITKQCPLGKRVSFVVSNKTYIKIESLIGQPGEYIIRRNPNRIGKNTRKHGNNDGMHMYLRKKVNAMLSRCGIGNDYSKQKKIHALRKYFETDRVFEVGRQQAANECGHTVQVQQRNYLGTLAGKIS